MSQQDWPIDDPTPDPAARALEPAPAVSHQAVPEDSGDAEDTVGELPEPPQTGDPAVDEAVGAVAAAARDPLAAQLPIYEAAHRTLQDRLADVEG